MGMSVHSNFSTSLTTVIKINIFINLNFNLMASKVNVKQVADYAAEACQGVSENLRSVALVRGTKFRIDVKVENDGTISQAAFNDVVERRSTSNNVPYLMIKTSVGSISAKRFTSHVNDAIFTADTFAGRIAEIVEKAANGYTFNVAEARTVPSTNNASGIDVEYRFEAIAPTENK